MKKGILSLMVMASCAATAGTMGPLATFPCLYGFVSGEGGYTWNQVNGINGAIDSSRALTSVQSTNGGTARVAAGMVHPVHELLFLSTEIGWGYYGYNKMRLKDLGVTVPGVTLNDTLWGFDILAGIAFNQPRYDLFFKAGALMENSQLKLTVDDMSVFNPVTSGSSVLRENQTEALPEIKLGGSYHICRNLSIFAAWTHVFGADEEVRVNFNTTTGNENSNINHQNPTLDVASAGLQYRFA